MRGTWDTQTIIIFFATWVPVWGILAGSLIFFLPRAKTIAKTKSWRRRVLLFKGTSDFGRNRTIPRIEALYNNPYLTSKELEKLATWRDPWAKIRAAKDPKTPLHTLHTLGFETVKQNPYIDLVQYFIRNNKSVPEELRTLWSLTWSEEAATYV